jgi:RNA polymerase sigma-70 factor (ECF subfamily)
VQETFLDAWKAFPTFRGDSKASTWLHSIAIRKALARLRADRRYAEDVHTDSTLAAYQEASAQSFPESRLDLERSIASLPHGARAVLVLFEIEGYAYDEIAQLLGVSTGTVRSQLHRARQLMKNRLDS